MIGKVQQQWGYYVESQNPTDYRYWSIPFTSHYITMATKTYYEPKEEAVPWLVGIDMQKFICGYGANFIGSSYVSCVGIGCQLQWGIKTEPYGLVTFPISFQTCFGVITHFNSDPTNYAETSSVTNFSNTDFYVVFYFNNSGSNAAGSQVFWVAIGNS